MTNNSQQKVNLKDLIRVEFAKCAADPAYFIRKYCMIQTQNKGRILFDLYPYQEETIKKILGKDNTIILKGRQTGISTVVACLSLWIMLFQKDKNVLVIATKQETAKNLITKVRFAFDNLPVWLQVPCIENNKLSLKFENGSEIRAVSSSEDSGRSFSVSLLILDEAAFIDKADLIWMAAQATMSTGGKAVLISSPNGIGNFFHKKYVEAEEYIDKPKDGVFFPIKLTWRDHPDRDERWKQRQLATLTEREFKQEHEAEFLGSGNTVIDAELVQFYIETYKKEPELKGGPGGDFWIWEQPDYSKSYIVVADVARGEESDSGDYSTCHVLEAQSCAQVAEYKGRISTNDFGNFLVGVASTYNNALLVIENGGIGWAVVQKVIDRNYDNLFYMTEDMKYFDPDELRSNKLYRKEKKAVAGFTTSQRTRPLIVSKLDQYMRDKSVIIRSQRTLNELLTFIWVNGKPEAQDGCFDDLVMAMAIGLWVRDTALQLHQRGIQLSKFSLDRIQRVQTYDPIMTNNNFRQDPYKINMNGYEHDLRQWL